MCPWTTYTVILSDFLAILQSPLQPPFSLPVEIVPLINTYAVPSLFYVTNHPKTPLQRNNIYFPANLQSRQGSVGIAGLCSTCCRLVSPRLDLEYLKASSLASWWCIWGLNTWSSLGVSLSCSVWTLHVVPAAWWLWHSCWP